MVAPEFETDFKSFEWVCKLDKTLGNRPWCRLRSADSGLQFDGAIEDAFGVEKRTPKP